MTFGSKLYKRSDEYWVSEAVFSRMVQSWLWDSQITAKKNQRLQSHCKTFICRLTKEKQRIKFRYLAGVEYKRSHDCSTVTICVFMISTLKSIFHVELK